MNYNYYNPTKLFLCLFFFPFAIATGQAQQLTVSGTISSEEEGVLPGVNIIVKGTTVGTVSDINGISRMTKVL